MIGSEIAVQWSDGSEDYFPFDKLREASPSAENIGETDILGRIHGASPNRRFHGITVTGWQYVGNYAIRFEFSDGHRTGIYTYEYLREVGKALRDGSEEF